MNKERIEAAIKLFKNIPADRLNMKRYYSDYHSVDNLETTRTALSCGTVACFAGWVGTLKEFKAAGGFISSSSWGVLYPTLQAGHRINSVPQDIAKFFGIQKKQALYLCGFSAKGRFMARTNPIYGVRNEEVQPHHIVNALQTLLQGN